MSVAKVKTAFARRAEFYDRISNDKELSRVALAVAWNLVNHINDQTGECFPSEERLAVRVNCSVRSVRRGVDQLVARGWFTKQRHGRGGTQYFANYENRTETSGFSDDETRTKVSGKDGENRTELSGKDAAENRTDLAGKPDKVGQENRTRLTAPIDEPLLEPHLEPQSPPTVPPADATDQLVEAVALWNELAERIGLARVQHFSEARRRKLRRRLAECGGLDGWRAALAKVEASSFLTGGGRGGWRADFDFCLQAKSFTKILEGVYDDGPVRGRRNEVQEAFARMDRAVKGGMP